MRMEHARRLLRRDVHLLRWRPNRTDGRLRLLDVPPRRPHLARGPHPRTDVQLPHRLVREESAGDDALGVVVPQQRQRELELGERGEHEQIWAAYDVCYDEHSIWVAECYALWERRRCGWDEEA